MTTLLIGLKEYHETLSRQLIKVRQEFQQVENRWQALSSVYEGTAADEFRRHWHRTVTNFEEYIDRTQQIAAALQERIEALQEADNAVGL
jgi:uncharacterized protein YukE